jgi:hypothetical protein
MKLQDVTKSLEGKYVEFKSLSSGKIWKGMIKKIRIMSDKRVIVFDSGFELIAHENFSFKYKVLG